MMLIQSLGNTTERNYLLLMRMDHLSKIVKMSSTAGSLKTHRVKNYKKRSRSRLVQIKAKNSSSLSKLLRTNWQRELSLSLIFKWMKSQSLIKNNLIIRAIKLLANKRLWTTLRFFFLVILTTQELNAWNNCSIRQLNLTLFLLL